MALKPRVVYLGTATQNHQNNTPDTSSGLVSQLQLWGYSVILASNRPTAIARLLHMIWVVLTKVDHNTRVIIDTYSTANFYGVVGLSWLIRLKGARYIPILHGGNLPRRLNSTHPITRGYFKKATALVAPSEYLAEVARGQNWPVHVISNGVNINDYAKLALDPITPPESITPVKSTKPVLLWVRAFDRIYRPELALNILKTLIQKYPEAELFMVGPDKDGSLTSCQEFAKKHNLKVHFTGKLPKKQWIQLAGKASIFLNTSAIDNAPVSVVEAMALGLPVVSSAVGGLKYLIENEHSGFLISEGQESDMATQYVAIIDRIFEGQYDLEAITDRARKKAELHDWSQVKPLWEDLFN